MVSFNTFSEFREDDISIDRSREITKALVMAGITSSGRRNTHTAVHRREALMLRGHSARKPSIHDVIYVPYASLSHC